MTMANLHWLSVHPAQGSEELKAAVIRWGYSLSPHIEGSTLVIQADRPDPRWIPEKAATVLWWVKEGSPEETSSVREWETVYM